MIKHTFLIVSADDNCRLGYENGTRISVDDDSEINIYVILNNTASLASVYNKFIDSYKDTSDYIYLMHSDVQLNINELIKHVQSVKSKYDVIGLCGCANIQISQTPLNWFCGSRPYPESRWGCVSHGELNGMTSFFSIHSPNITDHEVACIDGLCIIMTKKAIDSGLRFDENLGMFDCYDTDLSFQAVLTYQLKLGVVVRKDLRHYSVGKSILSRGFLETEIKLRRKWNFPIPPNSPIEKIATELSGNVN